MIPNSPVDPELVMWGWPWHGLIDGPRRGEGGTLHLPSGANMPCLYPDFNHTFLWDIGLPAPEVESENPDEQWLSRAILRANTTGVESRSVAWYGGAGSDGYPVYVPGSGTLTRLTTMTFNDLNQTLYIYSEINGRGVRNKELSVAEFGLEGVLEAAGLPIVSIQYHAMDESPDGRRTLYRLTPRVREGDFSQRTLFGRAIIEVIYTVGEEGFDYTINVLQRFTDTTGQFTNNVQTQADLDQRRVVLWSNSDPSISNVERMQSEGPPPGSGWTAVDSWSRGSQTIITEYAVAIWAWYVQGVAQLVRFSLTNHVDRSYGGGYETRTSNTLQRITATLEAGGTSASLETVTVGTGAADLETGTFTDVYSAQGQELYTVSGELRGIIDGITSYEPSHPLPGVSDVSENQVLIISNKLLAPQLPRVNRAEDDPDYEVWVGDALHPGGKDSGVHKIAHNDPNYLEKPWAFGSYNPITGAVVRHADKYCTWV